jgi:hypothetical protein
MSSFGSGSSPGTSGAKPATEWLSSAGSDFAGKRAVSRSISHTDGVRVQGRQGVSVQALRSTQEALEAAGLEE